MQKTIELICPAGTLSSLYAAVDAGANFVYVGFRDETNARNFPGLNFSREDLTTGIRYARQHGCGVYLAVNTYPQALDTSPWHRAIDDAANLGVDAVILADIGLLHYCAERYPSLRRHLSVQASASNVNAIRFYQSRFDVKRVVLPRVLTLKEIRRLNAALDIETEVFAFGGMCVMAEGRCLLSGYATGESPNTSGVCSPASHVRFYQHNETLTSKLGEFVIDAFKQGEHAGYPTLCKGKFVANGNASHLFEDPVSLNTLNLIPELIEAGITAVKIEGRQRGHSYVRRVVTAFRQTIDAAGQNLPPPDFDLSDITEGACSTAGAYHRDWR